MTAEVKSRPFEDYQVDEYEKKRYRGLDQRLVDSREKTIVKKIYKKIAPSAGLLLDLPCGYGRFSALSSGTGFYLVQSDISLAMVKRALNRPLKENLFRAGAVADAIFGLPFKENVFQAVLSMRFFHHLHQREDRLTVLTEFHRVSSSWVVLSFYRSNFLHIFQRKLRRRIKKSRTRIKMLTWREFKKELSGAGFKVKKKFSLFPGLHGQQIVWLEKIKDNNI
ncbi:MAG: class I SAM-dependent methyltransferase [Acidobacteriota bacterium]